MPVKINIQIKALKDEEKHTYNVEEICSNVRVCRAKFHRKTLQIPKYSIKSRTPTKPNKN